jgi:hypothetical protein
MIYTMRHIFDNARPIDDLALVVELLVLGVILYFEVGEKHHRKWLRRCHDKLFRYRTEGQQILSRKPNPPSPTHPSILPWEQSVKTWIQETAARLKRDSPKASELFLRDVVAENFEHSVNPEYWKVILENHIKHLWNLMENLDSYF